MRHILIFTNSFPNPIQPERGIYTGQIADELAKNIAVTVVTPLPWFPKWNFLERFPEWYLFAKVPAKWEWRGIPTYSSPYVVIPRLLGWSHALSIYTSAIRRIWEIHRKRKIDIINGQYVYPDGVAASIIGRTLGIPVVLTAHGSDINYLSKMPGRTFQIKWALKKCAAATAVSGALAQEMVALGTLPGKITTIPNGINDELFTTVGKASARRALGLPVNGKIILFVGNLREVKGLKILIKALENITRNEYNDIETFIVGEGPLHNELDKRIATSVLNKKVRIIGSRPHNEIPLWMSAADLFCLPSLNEGMPNVVLEALASGTPVIATNVGGIPDLIRNGNGILVPPGDVEALADALSKGLNGSWDKREIRESVRGNTWVECARRYAEVFESVIGGCVN